MRTAPLVLMATGLLATPLASHDFWLIPNAFRLGAGTELVVLGRTSSDFPTSLSAVTPDRIASARLVQAHGERMIEALAVAGNSLRLAIRPEEAGQAIVTATIHPRLVSESAESFRRYLTLEGAPEALERYERQGILPTDSVTRSYAKYAKTLVQVGQHGERVFDRVMGHPLEFVPLSDPENAPVGDVLRFRMLFRGHPLAHARGHASAATSIEATTARHSVEFETDEGGEFALPLLASGIWNVRALHIVPAPEGADSNWDVHWATFVWKVR